MQAPATGKQVVELNGYVIILVEGRDGKIKLYGSPAEKDNLEVADEILDINERKLEDLSRTEVIRHIHECIQSCMIKLRVKRRSDSRLAGELGNAVQDAFVIAVEQQARERLQRLSALKRITPVDMSQLSIKLNQQVKGATSQDLSFLKEASPIYVTSLSGNSVTTSSCTTATVGGNNELIVADSTQYSKSQQEHTRPPNISGGGGLTGHQQQQRPFHEDVNQNISSAVNQSVAKSNNIGGVDILVQNLSAKGYGGGGGTAISAAVTVTNNILNNNNNSSSTLNNNSLVNSNISVRDISNRCGAEVSTIPCGGVVNLNNNNHINSNSNIHHYEANNNTATGESTLLANGEIPGTPGRESAILHRYQNPPVRGGTEVLLGDQTYRLDNRPRRKSGTGILFVDEEDPLKSRYSLEDYLSDNNNPIDLHQQGHHPQYHGDIEMLTMLSANQQDNGPHREMAVDVPESFIARNKTPPRYPPRPIQNTNNHNHPPKTIFGESIIFPPVSPSGKKTATGTGRKSDETASTTEEESLEMISRKNSLDSIKKPMLSLSNNNGGGGSMGNGSVHTLSGGMSKIKSPSTSSSSNDDSTSEAFIMPPPISASFGRNESSLHGPPSYNFGSASDPDDMLLNESGPHRELPVDVPDSFVGTIKQTPRYPPVQLTTFHPLLPAAATTFNAPPQENGGRHHSINTINSSLQLNKNGGSAMQPQPQTPIIAHNKLNGSAKPVPPPRDHLRVEKDGRLVNMTVAPQLPDRKYSSHQSGSGQIAQIIEPTHEQEMSIKKFQEQLRRRKEEEDRIAQENEFLRASLRGSRKLQALQDGPMAVDRPTGIENDAFLEDDEAAGTERSIIGYGDFVAALQRLQTQLNKNDLTILCNKVAAAQSLLLGPGVARALATRTAVLQRRRPRISNPATLNAQLLAKDCVESLTHSNSSDAIELCDLLSTYEMEGLLQAHDRIAVNTDRSPAIMTSSSPMPMKLMNHKSNPMLQKATPVPAPLPPRDPLAVPLGILRDAVGGGGQDHIRIIQIEKSSEPLGATIRNEGEAIVIGRIVRGGAAEKSGLLHEGDEILEVNGTEMRGKSVNDVCAILAQMVGTLTFLIVPAGSPPPGGGGAIGREPQVLHVRAHFDYDPEDDLYIPCRELGISFQKGDVLHVISRDDPNWWQAYREGEEDQTLAGLIPSQQFQHQRESMKLAIAGESGQRGRGKDANVKGATLLCARKGRKKKKKASSEAGYPLYATTTSDEPEPEEILTYEEVSLYYPRASHKRPIVLIGPPNIGRHELRQRLMADSDRFAAAVPHTSRPQREGEVPGQDYHFITRAQFEADILGRKFVEHGEYEKAYYGTSLEAIRTVVASGKICVLNLHPQSLKLLRSSDLKPYVVLVAPPSLEKLRLKKIRSGEPFKEEELKEIIATARDMEARWGHLFDMIIINNETERAYHQLLTEINSLEREPQWVPTQWVVHT